MLNVIPKKGTKKITPALSAINKGKSTMKIDEKKLAKTISFNRRNFIKLIVGGAAGVSLTPLPWKLADDSTIWTQNWPWVPVPAEGAFSHFKTHCRLCRGGCGIEVRKVDR